MHTNSHFGDAITAGASAQALLSSQSDLPPPPDEHPSFRKSQDLFIATTAALWPCVLATPHLRYLAALTDARRMHFFVPAQNRVHC